MKFDGVSIIKIIFMFKKWELIRLFFLENRFIESDGVMDFSIVYNEIY